MPQLDKLRAALDDLVAATRDYPLPPVQTHFDSLGRSGHEARVALHEELQRARDTALRVLAETGDQ